MDDPTACWHRYLVAISALAPDEDEATQALIELVQWLRVGGRPPDGFTTSESRALVAGIKTDTGARMAVRPQQSAVGIAAECR